MRRTRFWCSRNIAGHPWCLGHVNGAALTCLFLVAIAGVFIYSPSRCWLAYFNGQLQQLVTNRLHVLEGRATERWHRGWERLLTFSTTPFAILSHSCSVWFRGCHIQSQTPRSRSVGCLTIRLIVEQLSSTAVRLGKRKSWC